MVEEHIVVPENFRTSMVNRCAGDDFRVWVVRKLAELPEETESESDSED